jgi:hypothetical protein
MYSFQVTGVGVVRSSVPIVQYRTYFGTDIVLLILWTARQQFRWLDASDRIEMPVPIDPWKVLV